MDVSIRTLQTTTLTTLLIILSVSSAGLAQPEEIVLDNPQAYTRNQREAVTFSHEGHMDMFDCLDCHHDYADGENVLDEGDLEEGNSAIRCVSCHGSDSTPDLRHAYHFQCMGCHRQMRVGGQATGPELCGECHIK